MGKRVQAIVSEEEYGVLARLARERRSTVSSLIREAIQRTFVEEVSRQERRQALAELLSLSVPVEDWDEMEREIERGALE